VTENAPELARVRALCSLLGNPERDLRFIHVAGTNGKGSVCRYLYEALRASGYSVGIFTSPHVWQVEERIEVDGARIATERLDTLTARVLAAFEGLAATETLAAVEALATTATLTEFEVMTAVGFLYFAEKRPDFVVLEAGLGGRSDATNVIEKPLVSVITQVALDHTDRLGATVERIAGEKAGIIKRGCPVVTGATGTAAEVIAEVSGKRGSPLVAASAIGYDITRRSLDGYTFDVDIGGRCYRALELAMAGEHQVKNAVTALCALDLLREQGVVRIDDEALCRALRGARLDARFQIVSRNPLIIVDGAHNPDGARALTKTLEESFPHGRFLFVCSFLRDKATRDMVRIFAQSATAFMATGLSYPRSLSATELGELLRAEGHAVLCESASPNAAYEAALRLAPDYDATIFAGSLYTAADIIQQATSPACVS
jgi:dihydrofolate synthase/folylpolyglutamate synthase